MHRWWGGAADSDKQAGERNQRAARRVIADQIKIQSDSEDENYEDCDLSHSFIANLDGNDSGSEDNMPEAPVIVLFEDENGTDDDDYYKKLNTLRNRNFNLKEVDFWFTSFETSLKHIGVKSQWSKREVLHSLLPDEVQSDVKNILKKIQIFIWIFDW